MSLTGLLTYSYDDDDDDWWCLQIYYDDGDDGEWLQLTLQVTTVH